MYLRLKAAGILVVMLGLVYALALMINQLDKDQVVYICIAILIYSMYTVILSYLEFGQSIAKIKERSDAREKRSAETSSK